MFFKYEQIKILHMKYYFGKCYKFWSLGELWILELWSFHFSSKENFKCLFPPDLSYHVPQNSHCIIPLAMSCECMFLGSVSRHNKDLEWRTLKPPQRVTTLRPGIDRVTALMSRMDHVMALRKISVTALFYLEDRRKIHLWGVRACQSKDTRRRAPQCVWGGERERASFGSSFYMFIFPWACPM